MPTAGPFPTIYADLNDYFNLVTPYLNAEHARLAVSGANLTALNDFYDKGGVAQNQLGWKQLWVLYANPDAVNKSIRDIIKTRRGQMQTRLRLIYNDIPESFLTENDRNTLNLPLRDATNTPIQPVTFFPLISYEKISNGIHILRFKNPQTVDSDAMPPSQVVELWNFVGAAGLADNAIPFTLLRDTGKHLTQINFLPAQKGQTSYYRARYKTPTGEYGPWSDVTSEIVL